MLYYVANIACIGFILQYILWHTNLVLCAYCIMLHAWVVLWVWTIFVWMQHNISCTQYKPYTLHGTTWVIFACNIIYLAHHISHWCNCIQYKASCHRCFSCSTLQVTNYTYIVYMVNMCYIIVFLYWYKSSNWSTYPRSLCNLRVYRDCSHTQYYPCMQHNAICTQYKICMPHNI
jgi:hypothetical protein